MADDALASGQPEVEQAQASQTQETLTQTADATQESEVQQIDPVKAAEEERLKFAENYHRKKLNEAGYGVAKVPEQHRERLRNNPNLIAELEAERDAFRRAALVGGNVGQVQQASAPPKDDSAETAAKLYLKQKGFTGREENYSEVLALETEREEEFQGRLERAVKKFAPDTKALANTVREEDRAAVQREEMDEVFASTEWNDPDKGPVFEGKFWRKFREIGKTRRWVPPSVLVAEIKAEQAQSSSHRQVQKPRPQMGESSSGKVSTGAGSDPFKQVDEAARSVGIDPDKFFG